jgi:hypothetical protein
VLAIPYVNDGWPLQDKRYGNRRGQHRQKRSPAGQGAGPKAGGSLVLLI